MNKIAQGIVKKQNDLAKSKLDVDQAKRAKVEVILRKEFNVLVKGMCVGLMAVMFYSFGYYKASENIKLSESPNISTSEINKLSEKIQDLKITNNRANNEKQLVLARRVEDRLKAFFQERSHLEKELIQNQKLEISKLKEKISKLVIGSNLKVKKETVTVAYTQENYSILNYEQRLLRMRFKEKQKLKHESFLLVTDLTTLKGKSDHDTFLHNQKMDYYKFKQKQSEELRSFRKKKYRTIASTSEL